MILSRVLFLRWILESAVDVPAPAMPVEVDKPVAAVLRDHPVDPDVVEVVEVAKPVDTEVDAEVWLGAKLGVML